MVRKFAGGPTKQLRIPQEEIDKAAAFAALNDQALSSLGRSWIEDFVEHGSDYVAPAMGKMHIVADPELIAKAEAKAREEHGCSLREIIRYEISQIDTLTAKAETE